MKQGWQIKKLGEVGTFQRGGNFLKSDFVDVGFPCIHYGQIHMKFGVMTVKHLTCIPEPLALSKAKIAHKGDVIIAITSEDVEGSCKCTAWMGDYDIAIGAHTAIYHHSINPVYVSYYLMSPSFSKEKAVYTHGFKVVEIRPTDIAKIPIPVPPLSEQQRIVTLLDAEFAKIDALKANAERNLQNAKDLFQAALKEELRLKKGWEEKCLPLIAENLDSKRVPITQRDRKQGVYPYYGASGIVDYVADYIFDDELLLISEDGANLLSRSTPIAFSVSGKIWVNNHAHILKFKDMCTQKLVEYYFASIKIDEFVTGAAQPKLTQANMNKIVIPVPPLQEQQTIVTRLDTLNERCKTLQSNYEKTIVLCDDLKQALLRKAFNGEI